MLFHEKVKRELKNLKAHMEEKRLIVMPLVIIVLFEMLFFNLKLHKTNIFQSVTIQSTHFNILSTNALFAGFLFTGLSILIGLSNKKIMKFLKEEDYLKSIYNSIFLGILFNILSIIMAILCMLNGNLYIQKIISNLEFLFLIIGIGYFTLTVFYDLSWLIKRIMDEEYDDIPDEDIEIPD